MTAEVSGAVDAVDEADRADDRQTTAARRVLLLAVAAIAMAIGAAIVLVAGGGDDDLAEVTDEASLVAAIGPAPGSDVGGYVAARRDALTEIDGAAVAAVSFGAYVPADEVDALVGDDVTVTALLVALPGSAPATTTEPASYRRSTVADAEAQRTEIAGLLPSVDDDEFAAFYRSELGRYDLVVAGGDRADIVFGVVVRATGPELRALATRPGVRVVDARPGTGLSSDASVRGLRPEETTTAGSPEFRPA